MSAHLADLLTRAAAEAPDRVALVEAGSGRRVTWAELDAEVDQVARGLNAQGLVAGYRVVIALGNRTEFVTSYLGVLRAGLVAVPVNPRSATGELVRLVADCGARVVVADAATLTTVRQAVAGLEDALVGADEELRRRTAVPRVVVVGAPTVPGERSYADLLAAVGTDAPVTADPERLAVLLYTSGTSGRPRAAMLTHRALLANVEQAARIDPPMLTGDDVVFGVLPLFHVYGLNAVLGQVLHQRARLVLVNGFDMEESLTVIEAEAVTVLPVAPPVFAYWQAVHDLGERLSGVRLVLSGSAPLSRELVTFFEQRTGLAVQQGYGLTEAAPVVTSTLCSATAKPGSVGAALPGIEIRLVDEGGHAPEGEDAGEIWVRGANLFSGYWPDGTDGPDAAGWFATGDVGFLDRDGDLFLVDRLKELVIVSGFNVYPSEVEDVVMEVDDVAEAAVIGMPDERTGEAVVAYVKATPSSSYSAAELEELVREHCAVRLARFKQPTQVHVVDELPHTVTGKVAKGRLRERARRRTMGLLE
ncbi:AMP-binding protein [Nocardioides panacis]|uniref:AMP-binding protein n=1 Tax=Nocardioides panacis TaxID=2849501 RepID=A0A975SWF8_9ACTN|nr:AMP-binding protein [Nocardioides panacis]QWZ07187.1 AMP-binding protein [Nocardioides panacis]